MTERCLCCGVELPGDCETHPVCEDCWQDLQNEAEDAQLRCVICDDDLDCPTVPVCQVCTLTLLANDPRNVIGAAVDLAAVRGAWLRGEAAPAEAILGLLRAYAGVKGKDSSEEKQK